jgi:hypothetical protein
MLRICPQKIDKDEDQFLLEKSYKPDADQLTKKDFLRHDELTTKCNSFLRGSSDYVLSHLKHDDYGSISNNKYDFYDSKELINKHDFVYAPKMNAIDEPSYDYKNDREDLEKSLKKFNLNEEGKIFDDRRGKYDLSLKNDHLDSYTMENNFDFNRYKNKSESVQSVRARNQSNSSYLPLKDVPVHDLVKKLRNEFELEGDIDRLSSKINVFWDK